MEIEEEMLEAYSNAAMVNFFIMRIQKFINNIY